MIQLKIRMDDVYPYCINSNDIIKNNKISEQYEIRGVLEIWDDNKILHVGTRTIYKQTYDESMLSLQKARMSCLLECKGIIENNVIFYPFKPFYYSQSEVVLDDVLTMTINENKKINGIISDYCDKEKIIHDSFNQSKDYLGNILRMRDGPYLRENLLRIRIQVSNLKTILESCSRSISDINLLNDFERNIYRLSEKKQSSSASFVSAYETAFRSLYLVKYPSFFDSNGINHLRFSEA